MGLSLKKREAQALLDKLRVEFRSGDHKRGWVRVDGRPILRIYASWGRGDVPGNIPDQFRCSLKVNEDQFRELVECSMTYDSYVGVLRGKGLV